MSICRIKKKIGWKPKISLTNGIELIRKWKKGQIKNIGKLVLLKYDKCNDKATWLYAKCWIF